ncbi:hypothetical protein LTR36_002045 [Oleoguttula mirabilis]|uniref:Uncharacterized protein n=1 Tax=Oleoguttula mirabilis TaxID=1507867 RepID=A0AAV9JM72_9PEZI|nr:hypothetical protein LTR36_002045 [Oleoguttula mirabilis]
MAPLQLANAIAMQPKRPSDRAIAFAISIVLSKPEDLSVREYIRLLRQHVAKGRRENAISSVYRHLDRSSFWRSEYERLKDALQAAEGESVDLRREVDTLKAKVENARPVTTTKKRKKVDEDVVMVPRDPKRTKRDASPTRGVLGTTVDVERDFDFADVGEIGNILMRSLFQVHAVLKSHHRTEASVLAHHLIRAASALPQVVHQIVELGSRRAISGPALLKSNLTAAGRAVASLIVGITRLSYVTGGAKVLGQVVYWYVKMYASLLSALEEASEGAAKAAVALEIAGPAEKKAGSSKAKGKAQQPKAVNLKDNPTLNTITCFLCGIIDLLDPKVDAHKALFEGFAYSTLNKLGARLYTCVFGRARGASLEDEIASNNQPDEIEDSAAPFTSPSADELDVKKAKLEAPYLIHLLTRLMSAAPAHLGATLSTKPGKAAKASSSNKGAMKGALAIAAKDRLQRTLVNCMFGTEGGTPMDERDELTDPFMDCLKMPGMSAQALPMPKVKEVEVREWFKEEVWRLVGWEVLGKEAGW